MTMGTQTSIFHGNIFLMHKRARQAPVKFMFKRVGYVAVSAADTTIQNSQDELVESALTHGATDFDNIEDTSGCSLWASNDCFLQDMILTVINQFTCEPDALLSLSSAITQNFSQRWNVNASELRYIPLEDNAEVSQEVKNDLKALVNDLENNEEVLQVWTSLQDDR